MTSKKTVDAKHSIVANEPEQDSQKSKASHNSAKHLDQKVNKDYDIMDDLIILEEY